jgi:hypothetical protein
MGKAKEEMGKSEAIRILLKEGMSKPRQIAEEAKRRWQIDIAAQYVSVIKGGEKKKGTKTDKKAAATGNGQSDYIGVFESAKLLVDKMGAEQAKRLIDYIAT